MTFISRISALAFVICSLAFGFSTSANAQLVEGLKLLNASLNENTANRDECIRQQNLDSDTVALSSAPIDVSLFKQYKSQYLDARCGFVGKLASDGYFKEFERDGLTAAQIAAKVRSARENPMFKDEFEKHKEEVDNALAELDKAAQDPERKDTKLKCVPDCNNAVIQCSYKGPKDAGWTNLDPI